MKLPSLRPAALLNRFLELLTDQPTGTAADAGRNPPAPAAPGDAARFQTALEATLRDRAVASGGRVELLDVGATAEQFGDRWPLIARKIDQVVEAVLSRRLTARDAFTRCEDGSYVILFQGMREADARLKCSLLAEEIQAKLFGDGTGVGKLAVAGAVADLAQAPPLTLPQAESLNALLRGRERYTSGLSDQEIRGGAIPPPIQNLLAVAEQELLAWQQQAQGGGPTATTAQAAQGDGHIERLVAAMRQAEDILGDVAAARNRALLHTEPESAPGVAGAVADPLSQLRHAVGQLLERAEHELEADRRRRQGGLDLSSARIVFRYVPMWHLESKALGCYRCIAGLEVGDQFISDHDMLPPDPSPHILAGIDRLVLHRAISDLAGFGHDIRKSILAIPVHHSTLISPQARQDYITVCKLLADDQRKYIVWEILDPRVGFSNSELPPTVALLKKFGRAVFVQGDLDHSRFDDFARIGIHGVGVDPTRYSLPEAELIRRLALFRARAERFGLKGYVRGVSSLAVAAAAICDGFEYVDGPPVASPIEHPGGLQAFGLGDLYRRAYPDAPATS